MKTVKIDQERLGRMISDGEDFLLLLTASWCGYCFSLRRELESSTDDFTLYELDISDEASRVWDEHGIQVVPTALRFRSGKEHSRKSASLNGLRVRDIKSLSSAP